MDRDRLDRDFTYHPPKGDDVWKFETLRNHAKNLAFLIDSYVPDSREKSLAITNLEQSVFWSNAGIARNHEVEGAEVIQFPVPESPGLPPLADKAREAIEKIKSVMAESKGCGGNCKCKNKS